jgi:hypothetical protein
MEKKNPKMIAYLYHKDAEPHTAKAFPFNMDDGDEDMSKLEIESYIKSKWSNLRINGEIEVEEV